MKTATKQQGLKNHTETRKLVINRLRGEMNLAYMEVDKLQKKIESIKEQIAKEEQAAKEVTISVSEHAVLRFKERIMDLPATKIRKMLTNPELTEAYKKRGAGKYLLKEVPDALLVVTDGVIVTVVNRFSPEEKLKVLGEYMNYFVDSRVAGEQTVMNFKQYRKWYYKYQVN